MTLSSGARLGPYEILSPLGSGGMGEVYRARDARLGRDVAIKVLPEHLSLHPEVRARFEREAKTVSSLNHPNICTLFDVGREGDKDYLVMELVEGESLAQRLAKGALPMGDVLRIGAQIADALDRAHRAGVIHRDLKPANVMLAKNGAKLMDFGLARETGMAGPGSGSRLSAMSQSPTRAAPLTTEGTIIGTFQYMAPEQLEGVEADARCDLWALGCVLHEMATGQRAFEGRSQASLISAIMTAQPAPVSQLVPLAPAALDRLVSRCLAKDVDDRWQSARDLMHELRAIGEPGTGSVTGAPAVARSTRRGASLWQAVAVAAAAFAAGAALILLLQRGEPDVGPFVLDVPLPSGQTMVGGAGDIALSPDGRTIVLSLRDSAGVARLWQRPLDGKPATPIEGTEGAVMPFWSPDGKSIGFFGGENLRRVRLAGGTSQVLCRAAGGRGASWGANGDILFTPGAEGPVFRVSDQGGTPVAVTTVDTARGEIGHRYARLLPDGRRFLYATLPAKEGEHEIFLGELGSTKSKFVMRADGVPTYTRDGWLIHRRNRLLAAQRFDPGSAKLTGAPIPLFEVGTLVGIQATPTAWCTEGGLLLTLNATSTRSELTVRSRGGERLQAPMLVNSMIDPALSPDGRRLVFSQGTPTSTSSSGWNLWTFDLARGLASQLTFDGSGCFSPNWSPDGREVVYHSNVAGSYALYVKAVDSGAAPRLLFKPDGLTINANDWTRDGQYVLYSVTDSKTAEDVHLLSMDGSGRTRPLLTTAANEDGAKVSPDGRWMVYQSDESGRTEVYVASFPGLGSKRQVSLAGGADARWRSDGRQIQFVAAGGATMGTEVRLGDDIETAEPVSLVPPSGGFRWWAGTTDDGRFIFFEPLIGSREFQPIAVIGWRKLLESSK